MTFQIKTPALVSAIAAFDHVIVHTKAGTIKPADAGNMVAAGKGVVQAVGTELRVRLAAPKLAEIARASGQAA